MSRIVPLAALCALAAGSASASPQWFEPVQGVPPDPLVIYKALRCTDLKTRAGIDGPDATYYLVKEPGQLVLVELDSSGSGAKLKNRWIEADGIHFFAYAAGQEARHYILPSDFATNGRRLVLASYSISEVGGVVKPVGDPIAECPMVPIAAVPTLTRAATVTPLAASASPTAATPTAPRPPPPATPARIQAPAAQVPPPAQSPPPAVTLPPGAPAPARPAAVTVPPPSAPASPPPAAPPAAPPPVPSPATVPPAFARGHEPLAAGRYLEAARTYREILASGGGQGYTIAVATHAEGSRLTERLHKAGTPPELFILRVTVNKVPCWAIYWGVFGSAAEAQAALESMPAALRSPGQAPIALSRAYAQSY
jgi:hypothetical protein